MNEQELILPVEIIEHILFYLDGSSMVKAGCVNSIWRSAYFSLLNCKGVFKNCCESEISPDSLLDILEKLYPPYPGKVVGEIDWFRVYRCWYFWRKIESWVPCIETIIEEYCCRIKCIKLSGDWLVYGTVSEGKVDVYNMNTKKKRTFYRGFGVMDIDLYNSFSSVSNNTTEERSYHDYIVLFLKNNHILSLSFNHEDQSSEIDSNVVYSECSPLQWLQNIRYNRCTKLKSIGHKTENGDILAATIAPRYFVTVDSEGEVHLGDCGGPELNSKISFKGYENIHEWYQLNSVVSVGIAFRQFHMLFFVVGTKLKPYKPCPYMFTITSVFLHCNLLFLGSSKGFVYLYKLKSDESILSLSLSKCDWKFRVARKSVVGIDIQYTKEYTPYLVVATESSIHRICGIIF